MCVHRSDDGKCLLFSQAGSISWCVDGPCEHEVPSMGDKIRAKTDEELAEFITEILSKQRIEILRNLNSRGVVPSISIVEAPMLTAAEHMKWLKQPVREE